jgi:hypothetical protein
MLTVVPVDDPGWLVAATGAGLAIAAAGWLVAATGAGLAIAALVTVVLAIAALATATLAKVALASSKPNDPVVVIAVLAGA